MLYIKDMMFAKPTPNGREFKPEASIKRTPINKSEEWAYDKVRKAVIPATIELVSYQQQSDGERNAIIVNKPTIQYIVEALASGIEDILIVTGRANVQSKTISTQVSN